jgi:hypothetical protein
MSAATKKDNCNCSKSKGRTFAELIQRGNQLNPCGGQEDDNESGSQSEAVRQIEGLLGGEKSWQEIG